jgi:hypothetical protein
MTPGSVPSNGTASDGTTLTYPARCGKTMDFPRFALSDGTRLFIADGGNDRVLIYKTIPTQNAAAADVILGQPDENASVVSSFTDLFHPLLRQSAADITPTPTGWPGMEQSLRHRSRQPPRSGVSRPGNCWCPSTAFAMPPAGRFSR